MICPVCGCRHGDISSADNLEDLLDGITYFDYDYEEICDMCNMMNPLDDFEE